MYNTEAMQYEGAGYPPGIVVARVYPDGTSVAAEGTVQLLGGYVLVAKQGVRVGKVRVHLREENTWKV